MITTPKHFECKWFHPNPWRKSRVMIKIGGFWSKNMFSSHNKTFLCSLHILKHVIRQNRTFLSPMHVLKYVFGYNLTFWSPLHILKCASLQNLTFWSHLHILKTHLTFFMLLHENSTFHVIAWKKSTFTSFWCNDLKKVLKVSFYMH